MNLTINNVSKLYKGNLWGLRNFNLELRAGVLGLLGPNGAGKSTLMRILATVTKATEGKVTWNGMDIAQSPNELRAVLGYLPQDFGVYPNLNAVEFLEYLAAIKGIESKAARQRIEELLQGVNLIEALATAIAIINRGRLLIHAAPENLLRAVENKAWEWVVPSAELPAVKQSHLYSFLITLGLTIYFGYTFVPPANANYVTVAMGNYRGVYNSAWIGGMVAIMTSVFLAIRLLLTSNWAGAATWLVGALFIPSLALALGVWSGSSKLFEVVYTMLWYIGPINRVPALDFIGATNESMAIGAPINFFIATITLLGVAVVGRKRQLLG